MLKSRRSGFTLAEVLVTIAIVAIIAAAVVPAVTSQITKGEETTLVAAVTSSRTALTAFTSDVRVFPGKVSQLTNLITITDEALTGNVYSAAQVARWRGPYSTTATFTEDDSIAVGLSYYLRDLLKDSSNFVVATISGVYTGAQASRLEALFESSASLSAGMVRWRTPSGSDTVPDSSVKIFLTSSR